MYDIIFVSYYEPNAEENFKNLYERFNNVGLYGERVKRVSNVKGIHNAHVEAAKISNTEYFFVVDGDAVIVDDFNFSYTTKDVDTVHVYRCMNPINDLVYGYGGVKLFPTVPAMNMDVTTNDMTTSISKNFKVLNEISNITAFNTDPFNTWKSAFRECAKLSSKTIDRQKEEETNERLKTWTTVGHTRDFGEFAIRGALDGMEFGVSQRNDLGLINDFKWLKEKFNGNT
ncbi:MAG: hypothetical protein CMA64_06100 [Euryarchaeota archaeon]|nr:hypothetical protein [Euryarchaeota archaeon]